MTGELSLGRRLLVVLAFGVAFTGIADAATVGPVTSTRLSGFAGTATSGAATVYASDNFTGASNTNLDGRPLVNGQSWVVGAGTWRLNTVNQVQVPGVVDGRAVTDTGQADGRVLVTTTDTGAGGRTSGLVVRSNPLASRYLAVHTENGGGGRVRLVKHDGAASTVLATFNGVALSNPANWAVELSGATVRVFYNGLLTVDHTLTAADLATFGGLTSHGMYNDNAGAVRFDDFRVESL